MASQLNEAPRGLINWRVGCATCLMANSWLTDLFFGPSLTNKRPVNCQNSSLLSCSHCFQVVYFLLPSLRFHSSALLLHSISPLRSVTSLLESLNAAFNGFTSDVSSLSRASLGVTQTFAQGFMLHCARSRHPLPLNSAEYTQIKLGTNSLSEETDGALNVIYALLFRPNTHRWTQRP